MPDVLAIFEAVRRDVNEHLGDFMVAGEKKHESAEGDSQAAFMEPVSPLRRYQVNLLVDSAEMAGAPVIYESNPTYLNLTGRAEQMAQMGALITDFMLIKPGMLHRANGGYLILDALKVLVSPYAWEGLKRALEFREIRIESALQMLSLTSTVSLEPEPVPLDVKVILLGDRMLYYLLSDSRPRLQRTVQGGGRLCRRSGAQRRDAAVVRPVDRPDRAQGASCVRWIATASAVSSTTPPAWSATANA